MTDRQTDGQTDRRTDRHPHRFMIWPHIVGHITSVGPVAMQPSDNGGRFPQPLNFFQGLKIGVPSGETSILKIG